MPRSRSARIVALQLPLSIAAAALLLRVLFVWKAVFLPGFTRFTETDAWYHMRVVDMIVAHFPRFPAFDPFLIYPHGEPPPIAPLFPWSIAAAAWALGGGHPSPQLVDATGAWTPPILGTIAVLALFFCARKLWSRGAATIAALLLAIMPSEFLGRSVLGYADHHVAETLFSMCAVLLLMIAFGQESRNAGFQWSIAAGASLAAYLLTWRSGLMFLVIVFVAVLAAIMAAAAKGTDTSAIAVRSAIALLSALLLVIPAGFVWHEAFNDAIAVAAAIAGVVLTAVAARGFRRLKYRALLVGATVITAVAVAIGLVSLAASSFARGALLDVHRLMPRTEAMLVSEATPLLLTPRGVLVLFDEFGAAGFLAIGGLGVLISRIRREARPDDVVFAVWSAAMFFAALAQVRFTYYLAAAVAMLCGFFWWALMESERSPRRRIAAVAIVIAVVFAPIVGPAIRRAEFTFGPTTAWHDALLWMRTHTPEPLGSDAAYYAGRKDDASYSVLAWWDFGYWITRIAHRVPVTNPTQQGAADAARALTATSEPELLADAQKLGARYVIVDDSITVRKPRTPGALGSAGFLGAMCVWSRQPLSRFFERVDAMTPGGRAQVLLFYPDYYRAMGVRLSTLGAAGATPTEAWVATTAAPSPGSTLRRLADLQRFSTYEAAAAFASADPARRIVGIDPLKPCVPIPPLTKFRQVYASAPVAIFERIE